MAIIPIRSIPSFPSSAWERRVLCAGSTHGVCGVHSCHRGFTLVEVLLTLCVLVIMSALAWPQLDKAFSNQRLRKAADIIRTQWCKARVEAMKMGSIQVFRYEVEGNKYRLDALTTNPSALQTGTTVDPLSNDPTQLLIAGNAGTPQNNSNLYGTTVCFEHTLPKDIFFMANQGMVDTSAAAAINSMPSTGNIPDTAANWSEPIFFYPDGTASSAILLLRNKQGKMIELFLRGLTGIVKVGDVTAAVEQTGL